MDYRTFHSWNVSPSKAIAIQKDLRAQLVLDQAPGEIQTVAGIDVSYTRGSKKLYASVVVLDLTKPHPENHRSFPIIETAIASLEIDFPYIPGLLSFCEIPVVLSAWGKLRHCPDCRVCDGQALAHHRRMGLAAAVEIIFSCQLRYRLPEPIRMAHYFANEARRKGMGSV